MFYFKFGLDLIGLKGTVGPRQKYTLTLGPFTPATQRCHRPFHGRHFGSSCVIYNIKNNIIYSVELCIVLSGSLSWLTLAIFLPVYKS